MDNHNLSKHDAKTMEMLIRDLELQASNGRTVSSEFVLESAMLIRNKLNDFAKHTYLGATDDNII